MEFPGHINNLNRLLINITESETIFYDMNDTKLIECTDSEYYTFGDIHGDIMYFIQCINFYLKECNIEKELMLFGYFDENKVFSDNDIRFIITYDSINCDLYKSFTIIKDLIYIQYIRIKNNQELIDYLFHTEKTIHESLIENVIKKFEDVMIDKQIKITIDRLRENLKYYTFQIRNINELINDINCCDKYLIFLGDIFETFITFLNVNLDTSENLILQFHNYKTNPKINGVESVVDHYKLYLTDKQTINGDINQFTSNFTQWFLYRICLNNLTFSLLKEILYVQKSNSDEHITDHILCIIGNHEYLHNKNYITNMLYFIYKNSGGKYFNIIQGSSEKTINNKVNYDIAYNKFIIDYFYNDIIVNNIPNKQIHYYTHSICNDLYTKNDNIRKTLCNMNDSILSLNERILLHIYHFIHCYSKCFLPLTMYDIYNYESYSYIEEEFQNDPTIKSKMIDFFKSTSITIHSGHRFNPYFFIKNDDKQININPDTYICKYDDKIVITNIFLDVYASIFERVNNPYIDFYTCDNKYKYIESWDKKIILNKHTAFSKINVSVTKTELSLFYYIKEPRYIIYRNLNMDIIQNIKNIFFINDLPNYEHRDVYIQPLLLQCLNAQHLKTLSFTPRWKLNKQKENIPTKKHYYLYF